MSFLFPLFLAAGAAVLAPLLLHLRRQPPTKVTEFSSLQFLEPTALATTTRRKLERWLLLLLRCLALLLLALMFARPYRADDATTAGGATGTATVLLLDESASMSRAGLWDDALARALEHVAASTPADRLALGTFSGELIRRVDFTELDALGPGERAAIIKQALSKAKPTQRGTSLDLALTGAAAWLDDTRLSASSTRPPASRRQIVLISDLQEGADTKGLSNFSWPQDVSLTLEPLEPEEAGDLSLALAAEQDSGDPVSAETIRIRLTNAPEGDAASYQLVLDGDKANPKATGQIQPGTTRILRVPRPTDTKPHVIGLAGDDGWALDNQLHLAPIQPQRPLVLAVASQPTPNDAQSPIYYLQRALQPTPQMIPIVKVSDGKSAEDWASAKWGVVIVDGSVDQQLTAARAFVEKGGHVLVTVSASAGAKALEPLLGKGVSLSEAGVKDYALLTELDTKHPTLQVFADPRLSNLSQLHIWHHRVVSGLSPAAKILASYDDQSPALLNIPVGKGQVHLLTTTWAPSDSQLALVPQFIPLLYSLLQQTGASLESTHQLVTGQALPGSAKIAEVTGITTEGGQSYAANLPPEESRLSPLSPALFAGRNIPVNQSGGAEGLITADNSARLTHEALENRQQYWLILLATLLWIVGLETWLSSRRQKADPAVAS